MYLRYALLAPLSLAFNLFVMVTAPVWASWAALADIERLPWVFAWVHTHDDDIYGPVESLAAVHGCMLVALAEPRLWL
ncbi:hypothetical protein SLT36_31535 (plasmid) [Aminobacter sp. BA135]|jgi:hypothetical protein|uniref:DUF7338 family protein n=1 Tax=Aminobacter TaxID=31988 RepID=UPI003D792B41